MAAPAYKSHTTAVANSGNASFSIAAPAGVASGDYQIVSIVYASSSGNVGTTPSGWTLLDNTALTLPSGDTCRVAIYESTTALGAFAFTWTSARVWAAVRAAYTLPAGSSGRIKALGKNIETPTGTTTHATPAMTTTAVDSLIIVTGGLDSTSASQNWTGFGNFTSRAVVNNTNTSEREVICLADRTLAAATANVTANFTSALADEAGMYAIVLEGVASGATPPTVSAGADVTNHPTGTAFTRTATENDNGSAITARGWEIISGPADVGASNSVINVSYTPTVAGTYTFRYHATNAGGTTNDDMTLQVVAPAALLPYQAMNIGFAPGKVHIAVDVAPVSGAVRELHETSEIEAGYTDDPGFKVVDTDWVHFEAQADGNTTSGSGFPRSESRETEQNSDINMAFNHLDGNVHWMRVRERIVTAPSAAPHICTAQLHSLQDDILMVRSRLVNGVNTLVLRAYDPPTNNTIDVLTLDSNYTLGEIYDIMILIKGAYAYVYYNDFVDWVYRTPLTNFPSTGTYFFKWGAYLQFNETTSGVASNARGAVEIKNASHWHTGWTAPDNYFDIPTVDPGAAGSVAVNVEFTRTATETGTGITERKWAILDGPAGAGTTIGTAAALAWTPTVAGEYTLAYGAKNAEGWSNPTFLTVTVTSGAGGGSQGQIVSRTTGESGNPTATTTHTITMPSGIQAGDQVLVAFTQNHANVVASTTSPGWIDRDGGISGNPQWEQHNGTTSNVRTTLFLDENATAGGHSLTITTATAQRATWIIYVIRGALTPLVQAGDNGGTNTVATFAALTGQTTGDYFSILIVGTDYNTAGFTPHLTNIPAGYSTNVVEAVPTIQDSGATLGMDTLLEGATGASPGTVTFSTTGSEQWTSFNILIPAIAAAIPTVNAGTDDQIDQFETFARTAIEDNGGATITAREWRVISGPNQVNAVIGTAAALSWAPTVPGTYILRYSATNVAGTGTDELEVNVAALDFPVSANLRLIGSLTGAKNVAGTGTGNIRLLPSSEGQKRMSFSPTATLHLAASAIGQRINTVAGVLKLSGAAINVGRPGEANVSGNLKLSGAAVNTTHVVTGINRTANLKLQASVTGFKNVSATRSATVKLAASIANAFKNIPFAPAPNLVLHADIANTFHASGTDIGAELFLAGQVSNRAHNTQNVNVTGPLILHGSSTASSVRFNNNVSAFLRLRGTAFGQRIITEIAGAIRPRADTTTKYELVMVARIPQASGPPAFFEVEPLDWVNISYAEELSGIPTLSANVKISSLTDSVKLRLQALHDLPCELWLYRNGKHVFAGPLLGFNAQNEEAISLEAQGLLAYTQMWHVTQNLNFKDTDQFVIAKSLIDQWQILEYGNFGIDTGEVTPIPSAGGVATYRGVSSNAQTNVTNAVAAKPVGTVEGDLLIAVHASDSDGSLTSMTAPTGWTLLGSDDGTDETPNVKIWRKTATYQEPDTYTFADSSLAHSALGIIRIDGQDIQGPIAVSPVFNSSSTSSTNHTAPSVAGKTNGLLITVHAADTAGTGRTYTPPTGMTERVDINSGAAGSIVLGVYTQDLTADTVTGIKTAVCSGSHDWVAASLVIAPAPPVTPPISGPQSGVKRTISYPYREIHNVYDRLIELTKMANGFDISIDPASRQLELYYPQRGVDRSVGEDRIVFDERNVTSSNIVCSVAPQDLASEGLATGTGTSQDETFVATISNEELRAKYGRTGITGTFNNVDQTTLVAYTQAMVDARDKALLIPGPNARVSVDSDIASYDVGDTIDYQLHSSLPVAGAYRIRKRTVSVKESGTESVSIEFV